jgi:SAM-dependent methyltransferase
MSATAAANSSPVSFSTVTEQPGQLASRLQLDMMAARYAWAAGFAEGRDVLEVACGAGMGLGLLASRARSVEAGDLDGDNLAAARRTYAGEERIRIRPLDAMQLPYAGESFDLVLLFEAIYYLADAYAFFAEAHRVLRPGGLLLIATVNCEWEGFNPSPFSIQYFSASQLRGGLQRCGFEAELKSGFPEQQSASAALVGAIRRAAVGLHLVPRTMSGKALLKRLFYGRLQRVPARLSSNPGSLETLTPVLPETDLKRYRVLYASARKTS